MERTPDEPIDRDFVKSGAKSTEITYTSTPWYQRPIEAGILTAILFFPMGPRAAIIAGATGLGAVAISEAIARAKEGELNFDPTYDLDDTNNPTLKYS